MPDIVIQIDDLWKRYRLGVVGTGTLAHDLNRWWAGVRGKPDPFLKIGQRTVSPQRAQRTRRDAQGKNGPQPGFDSSAPSPSPSPPSAFSLQPSAFSPPPSALPSDPDYIWALRGISLEIRQGEVIGIIGRNGAGKSTLLKILSRVTAPTRGEVRIRGRIASLLEVGTGFHPELTGRENVYLNGAILGMTRAEVRAKFDEIVAFAEVDQFVDTPVKRYSSGMYVRLAFAVAAHLEPEILIVDEVLAVGDIAFQKKCLGKMGEVAQGGRTVLFVSHNMASIQRLCQSAVLLEGGAVARLGEAGMVTDYYLQGGMARALAWERADTAAPAGLDYFIRRFRVARADGSAPETVTAGEEVRLAVEFVVRRPMARLLLGVNVEDMSGTVIFSTAPETGGAATPREPGRYTATLIIPAGVLLPRTYVLRPFLGVQKAYDWPGVLVFPVADSPTFIYTQIIPERSRGVIDTNCTWAIEHSG
jgi:lipopolysaccharide transport system ATP-binding protein